QTPPLGRGFPRQGARLAAVEARPKSSVPVLLLLVSTYFCSLLPKYTSLGREPETAGLARVRMSLRMGCRFRCQLAVSHRDILAGMQAEHVWSRRTFLAAACATIARAAEPVIDIHQHTNYNGRTKDE